MENIIEVKTCKHCNSKFEITDKDLEFYEKVSPVFNLDTGLQKWSPVSGNKLIKNLWNWKIKYLIPLPLLCPDCRAQNILAIRNERNLYKRKCDATWKEIISIHKPWNHIVVYDQNYWWWDKWNPLDYGKDFDFSKSFFEQFKNLYNVVPQINLNAPMSEKSEFTNQCQWNKRCYMMFCTWDSEECYYGMWNQNCKYCMDCLYIEYSEYCYEVINAKNSYKCYFSKNIENCNSVYFSRDLINCKNCIWCVNLQNKEYFIFNKIYSKEEYFKKLDELNIFSYKQVLKLKEEFKIFEKDFPVKYYNWKKNDFFSWDYIENSKEAYQAYNCRDNEETKYCRDSRRIIKSYDLVETLWVENSYSNEGSAFINKCIVWMKLNNCNNVNYSSHCNWSDNLFWCIWINNWSYCILNKQYKKSDYEELVQKIIKHMIETWEWWEHFPAFISPFWYNETVAMEYFPLNRSDVIPAKAGIYSKEEVIKKYNDSEILKSNNSNGSPKSFREFIDSWSSQEWQLFHWPVFNRSDYKPPEAKVDKIIPANKLPENITDIPDDILNWAIKCEVTWKPFRIVREELEFYRKHNLPIPRKHHNIRHLERMKSRNPRKLYDRKCDKCWIDIKTTYNQDRPEIVYCEKCYEKKFY